MNIDNNVVINIRIVNY